MFGFIKKVFVAAMIFFSRNTLKCVSMNDQECEIRPEVINANSDNLLFYRYSIERNKCNGNCYNINGPYGKLCVPDVVKNVNGKIFNLMSRTNGKRHIKWHENFGCKCRLQSRTKYLEQNGVIQ